MAYKVTVYLDDGLGHVFKADSLKDAKKAARAAAIEGIWLKTVNA